MSNQSITVWHASSFLTKHDSTNPLRDTPYALIILNQSLENLKHIFPHIWENASIRLCADGGANRLYDAYDGTYIPDIIRGDLDSLRSDVAEFFKSKGAKIEKVDDQDSTDLMKCIEEVRRIEKSQPTSTPVIHTLVILPAIGGRLDQTLSSIHYLHTLYKAEPSRKAYLLASENIVFLLSPGKHSIKIDSALEGPSCGIVPIGVAGANISTKGLRWELAGKWSIGDQISTSNEVIGFNNSGSMKVVEVETDANVVWMIELKEK